jgi:predicted permease
VITGATGRLQLRENDMHTATTAAPAVPQVKHGRARALSAAAGVLAAACAWAVEVPALGIHLHVRFGTGAIQTISVGQIIGVTAAAALLGWLLLARLERRTSRARVLWSTIAVATLAVSLALPLAAATSTAAVVGLVVMHLAVGGAVIPAMARTARSR